MSRIVVKNLPKKITASKLQEIFSEKGQITDLQLKYKNNGVFRQFAFIGYKTEEQAEAAKEYFHDSFIQTGRVKIEICRALGDVVKGKPDSKQSTKNSLNKNIKTDKSDEKNDGNTKEKKKEKKSKSSSIIPDELKNDTQFTEFLQLSSNRKSKTLWGDDGMGFEDAGKETEMFENNSVNSGSDDKKECDGDADESKVAETKPLSDMEYLKTKMVNSSKEKSGGGSKKVKTHEFFTVKLRNLPYKCKKKQLKEFFSPLKLVSIRIPRQVKGIAFIGFTTEKDMKRALNKNRGFLEGRRVEVVVYQKDTSEFKKEEDAHEVEDQSEDALELLSETGRLFVRNLCFSVTEDELKELFLKYGPIAELHVPIDFNSKKSLGFAFISYVFAEHAVKAFTELDGSIFQGRVLHIIPAKPKKEFQSDPEGMTFKEKKQAKLKALSQSSHNWNTLFLDPNAIADVITERYNINKMDLYSSEAKDNRFARVALAETQVVLETREFLIRRGVKLDAFSQAATMRSKTVILVKHLPAKTSEKQLLDVFSDHGTVKRVIVPPTGVIALVEFQEPTEAKIAFKRLAYSKFAHKPLFLEWAPVEVLTDEAELPKEDAKEVVEKDDTESAEKEEITPNVGQKDNETEGGEDEEEDEEEDDEAVEEGTTIFVKNLNFETQEERLRKHFEVCGPLHSVSVSKKTDRKTGALLSMGFGFVQYKHKSSAVAALNDLQQSILDEHSLELKFSNRAILPEAQTKRKLAKATKQKTTKICVRNIPFQASANDIRMLFQEFGELRSVRLPKKSDGSNYHRGFGFVDFVTKNSAKRAFETLCHSTHFVGRRLVLEWANPDSEDVDELRKKTIRDFHRTENERPVKKAKLMQDAMLVKPANDS